MDSLAGNDWQERADECVDRLEILVAGLMAMTEPLPGPILDEMARSLDALIVYRGSAPLVDYSGGNPDD